jgi:integrase
MSRRANGEGTKPKLRPDGRWAAQIRVEYPDGARRRVNVYGRSAGECRDKTLALRNAERDRTLTKPNPATVSAFLEQWLSDVVEPVRRAKTVRGYRSAIKRVLEPAIGSKRLQQLTPAEVQRAIAGAPNAKGARSRELAYVVLHSALETAVKWGIVARNVCDAVEKPTVKKRPIQFLTPDELAELRAAAAGDRLRAIYSTLVLTGIRPGEAFALRWDQVDLAAATMTITSTLDATSREEGETKSARGKRTIDMPPQLVAELW